MKTALSPVIISRLEKAAIDNGFDHELPRDGNWLVFASTQCPLQLWLTSLNEESFCVALSMMKIADALLKERDHWTSLPQGAVACIRVETIPDLHHLVRRAFQLSKTLPDEPLHLFERRMRSLPKTTEAERLVTQRVGQDIFREALLDYWASTCAVTGITLPSILRASHMKPWSRCVDDAERLNVFNGLLLVANMDALFDRGLVTFEDSGALLISPRVSSEYRKQLHLDDSMRLRWVADEHLLYLHWHRENLFERI